MATWKRILVEGDVAGSGVITVSGTAPHSVALGDPVDTTSELSPVANDDKVLIWDESGDSWKYINYSALNINLGNSDLTQSDTNRTFDIANGGSLTFIGNNAANFIVKSKNSSGTEKVRTTIGEAIEAFSDSGQSFGGLKVSSFTTSDTKKYGIWLEGGYTSNDAASAPNLIAFERIYDYDVHAPAANDEIATLEFYSATTTSQGTSSSDLQSNYNGESAVYAKILTGIVNPATAAYAGFIELGSYKVVALANSTTTGEFAPALRVDEIGVKINPKVTLAGTSGTPVNTNNDFYLPLNRGSNGQVLTTNGLGATSWTTVAGGTGAVTVTGTPAENEIAIFSDSDTLKSTSALFWFPSDPTLFIDGKLSTDGVIFNVIDPPTLTEGLIAYDLDKETLIFEGPNGEITLGETFKPVYNNTGSTIAKGTVVKAVGVNGEQFSIDKFDASAGVDDELYLIGVTQAAIDHTKSGIVVSEGVVKHLDTSSYSVGQILYASETPGAFTTTKPASPNYGIPVAMVIKVDSTNGQIYVRPTFYSNLNDIHDVHAPSPSDDSILQYNSANSRYELTTAPTFTEVTTPLISAASNLEVRSNGNVDVYLDYDNNESTRAFTVKSHDGTTRLLVREDGRIVFNSVITFPTTAGTAGQVMTSNSSGSLTFKRQSINQVFTQATSVTITTGSWSLSGGYYKASISNGTITSTCIVDVIPDNASYQTVLDAVMLPRTESGSGVVDVYAKNLPAANITCTLNILETAAP